MLRYIVLMGLLVLGVPSAASALPATAPGRAVVTETSIVTPVHRRIYRYYRPYYYGVGPYYAPYRYYRPYRYYYGYAPYYYYPRARPGIGIYLRF